MRIERRLALPCPGDRAVEAPLTWGQIAIWDVLRWLPPGDASLNQVVHAEVPPPRNLPAVLAAVAALLGRHESLRSLFLDCPAGQVQRVVADGTVPVDVVDTARATAAASAVAVANQARTVPFDEAVTLPVRVTVLTEHGVPVRVVLVLSHLAADGWSTRIVQDELAALLRDPGTPLAPAGMQPVERSAWEASAEGRQRNGESLAFWEHAVNGLPAAVFGGAPPDAGSDLAWAEIHSVALGTAASALARRLRVAPALVVQAGLKLVIGAYTGEYETVLRMIVATRFTARVRRLVGAFNQNALSRVRIADEPFSRHVVHAADAELLAYGHAEYHPHELDRLLAGVAARRSAPMHGFCFFNDVSGQVRQRLAVAPDPRPGALTRQLAATRIRPLAKHHQAMGANLFFYLHAAGPQAWCSVGLDRRFVPGRTPAGLLADLEWTLVRAGEADEGARLLWRTVADAGTPVHSASDR